MFITSGVSQYKILSYINEQSENSCPGKPNQEKNKSLANLSGIRLNDITEQNENSCPGKPNQECLK